MSFAEAMALFEALDLVAVGQARHLSSHNSRGFGVSCLFRFEVL